MLTKNDILKNFSDDESQKAIRVYETLNLAYNKGIPLFTKEFVQPNIWSYFVKNFNCKNFKVDAQGGYQESDRRIMSFNNDYDIPYPYKMIVIKNESRFSKLAHKDYLGALMSLGINREKFGDLVVDDNKAYVPIFEEVVDYVMSNLIQVGNSPVIINIVEDGYDLKNKYTKIDIIIPSLRIDNFIAKLAKISRVQATEFINKGNVLIDYSKVQSKNKEVTLGQIITIPRVGKFKVGNIIGSTKSGKYKIEIIKYM